MKVVLYLHGFASSGENQKAEVLRDLLPDHLIVSPTLDSEPRSAIRQIDDLIMKYGSDLDFVVGTSLGGLYADYVHCIWGFKVVLLNPITSSLQMLKFIGENVNYNTGHIFQVDEDYIQDIIGICEDIYFAGSEDISNRLVFLSDDDNLININDTMKHFKRNSCIIVPDDHRMNKEFRKVINETIGIFTC